MIWGYHYFWKHPNPLFRDPRGCAPWFLSYRVPSGRHVRSINIDQDLFRRPQIAKFIKNFLSGTYPQDPSMVSVYYIYLYIYRNNNVTNMGIDIALHRSSGIATTQNYQNHIEALTFRIFLNCLDIVVNTKNRTTNKVFKNLGANQLTQKLIGTLTIQDYEKPTY